MCRNGPTRLQFGTLYEPSARTPVRYTDTEKLRHLRGFENHSACHQCYPRGTWRQGQEEGLYPSAVPHGLTRQKGSRLVGVGRWFQGQEREGAGREGQKYGVRTESHCRGPHGANLRSVSVKTFGRLVRSSTTPVYRPPRRPPYPFFSRGGGTPTGRIFYFSTSEKGRV